MVTELKAIVVMANLLEEGVAITRDQCMSVEHFDYRCARKRDAKGRTYRASEPAILNFSVRINSAEQAQPFYKQLTDSGRCPLSFIFNATFANTSKRLTDYDDALVVDGYVVDVQEDFQSSPMIEQREQQILFRARMLVRSIIYKGRNDNYSLCFIQ